MTTQDDEPNHEKLLKKPTRKLVDNGEESLFNVRRGLKTHFKILYIAMVFSGMTLVWYGIWKIVQNISILNNPFVAIVLGLLLLGLTGRINKLE